MKKNYMKPMAIVVKTSPSAFMSSSGNKVYTNQIVSGSNQLSRRSGDWDDEEDE